MRVIHLKLPNEKWNEASLTERSFCEREGEQDGRWPIVSNVISILVDGFPMWVSCTRASGCLQSYRIHSWLLGESPHRRTHMHWYEKRQKSVWFICWIISTLVSNSLLQTQKQPFYIPSTGILSVLHLALCLPEVPLNHHDLALPLAQQLWQQLRVGVPSWWIQPMLQAPNTGCKRRKGMFLDSSVERVFQGGWSEPQGVQSCRQVGSANMHN